MILTVDPLAVRLPMVLLLLFALFTMFWSMDRIFGHRVALSAVIVAATSPLRLACRAASGHRHAFFAMVSAALFALMGYLFGDEADAEAQEASVDAPAVWVLAALVGVLVEAAHRNADAVCAQRLASFAVVDHDVLAAAEASQTRLPAAGERQWALVDAARRRRGPAPVLVLTRSRCALRGSDILVSDLP